MKRAIVLSLACVLWFAGCETGVNLSSDDQDGANTDNNSDGLSLGGNILAETGPSKSKAAGDPLPVSEGFMVVAQSSETGEIYRAISDADGAFQVDLPDSEMGSTFMVSIVKPDGHAGGPVIFDQSGDQGKTGIGLDRAADLGTVMVPADTTLEPITPHGDGDVAELVSPDVVARLNSDGVPVGVGSAGKGDSAQVGGLSSNIQTGPQGTLDSDQDGLPDVVDADDNGNGIVDEFDVGGGAGGIPASAGIRLNFFMNLKIDNSRSSIYYNGTTVDIEDALKTDTVITFEVLGDGPTPATPTAVRVLDVPAPDYLPLMTKNLTFEPWSDSGYAFENGGDRLQAFIIPNEQLTAGDTFTVEVEFDDGSTQMFSRMINYVFKNIPKLLQHGTPSTLTNFSGAEPVMFDGAQDLVLIFNPPTDDTGDYLTGMDYQFEIFYNGGSGQQLNGDIDRDATWPTPPTGFQTNNLSFFVSKDDLTLAGDNTYTVTLPKEVFVDTVQTATGSQAVANYKIDIAAQNGGNAAIMLTYDKL